MRKTSVTIASPIHQKPDILKEFLRSLAELDTQGIEVFYHFIDDNAEKESTILLQEFAENKVNVTLEKWKERTSSYECNEEKHIWKEELIWRVANMKNHMLQTLQVKGNDFLFLVDSDLVLHPQTLTHLISLQKEIVSEIFWTKWEKSGPALPQVWKYDQYTLWEENSERPLTDQEKQESQKAFLLQLKEPGVYPVGGLGACTLIKKSAVEKGVSFEKVSNVTFVGEDRHFCIRAAVLGIELFVDTHFEAYHIYREKELAGVQAYKQKGMEKETWNQERKAYKAAEQLLKAWLEKSEDTEKEIPALWAPNKVAIAASEWEKERKKIIEEKESSEIELGKYKIKLEKDKVSLHAVAKRKGYKRNWYFEEEMVCLASFQRLEDTLKLISVEIINKPQTPAYFQRHAKKENNKVVLSMIVKNEASRFLKQTLEQARKYIDEAVIIDDGSTDETIQICREMLAGIPVSIVQNQVSLFSNEVNLRKKQWEETIKRNPDWILNLDADECFEGKMEQQIQGLINQRTYDYYAFRLYDFWDEEYYREDSLWNAHTHYKIFLVRYQPHLTYQWLEAKQHCGRFPRNVQWMPGTVSDIRLKHFGWSRPEDRLQKYERYKQLDPEGQYGNLKQYESILDENPNLLKWHE